MQWQCTGSQAQRQQQRRTDRPGSSVTRPAAKASCSQCRRDRRRRRLAAAASPRPPRRDRLALGRRLAWSSGAPRYAVDMICAVDAELDGCGAESRMSVTVRTNPAISNGRSASSYLRRHNAHQPRGIVRDNRSTRHADSLVRLAAAAMVHANKLVLEQLLGSRPLLGLLAQAEQDELRRQTRARMHAPSARLGRCPAGLGLEGAGWGGAHVSKRL